MTQKPRKRLTLLIAALAATGLLTACTQDAKPPAQGGTGARVPLTLSLDWPGGAGSFLLTLRNTEEEPCITIESVSAGASPQTESTKSVCGTMVDGTRYNFRDTAGVFYENLRVEGGTFALRVEYHPRVGAEGTMKIFDCVIEDLETTPILACEEA